MTDEAALRQVCGEVGPVDVLVNSAGIVGPGKPMLETTAEEWRQVLDVNVVGTANTMRVFVPSMCHRGWGRVVNFASMAGKDGNPGLSIYSASKAAVIGLTKSVGKELATTGVLVNAIAPAVIATPMNEGTAPDVLAHITSLIPMKRLGGPRKWPNWSRSSVLTGSAFHRSCLRHQRRQGHLLNATGKKIFQRRISGCNLIRTNELSSDLFLDRGKNSNSRV